MVQCRARLKLEDAVQHLYHFCATLPVAPYTDPNPIFTFEEHFSGDDERSISAKVLLPNSVDAAVRSACSKSCWITEKMARKDAAFEAYKALHKAGLVDEHLLPLGHTDEAIEEAYGAVQKRPGIVKVSELIDPWPCIAQSWQTSCQFHGSLVKLRDPGQARTEMTMLLPVRIPAIAGTTDLYWDQDTTFQLTVEPEIAIFPIAIISSAAQITFLLLESVFRSRIEQGRYDFIALFMPSNCIDHLTWLSSYSGMIKAAALRDEDFGKDVGLVRDLSHSEKLHVFTQLSRADPNQRQIIEVKRLPKRADFLHPISSDKEPGLHCLPANECEVAKLPFSYSRFALFIPAILYKVQVAMIVERLCNTILYPLQFQERSLVTSAISASSAQEPTDYQRLETLGDSILKYMTSLTLMAEHLNYHEGIRTYFRRIFILWIILGACIRSVYPVVTLEGSVSIFSDKQC